MEQRKKSLVYIINPVSGTGKQKDIERRIRQATDASRFDLRIVFSSAPGHATQIAAEAVSSGAEIVVAVGGDGTVNEVGRALVGTPAALGIIPLGSGNGLARHLKIPGNIEKAVTIVNRGRGRKIDTATLNGRLFFSIAGVGYDAFVARKFSKASRRGFLTYFKIVTGEYPNYVPHKYLLEVDGKVIKRKALLITFANSNQFGNNTSIDPKARIDDGLIDLCIVRKIPVLLIPLYAPLLFTKSFHRTHYVEILRAKHAVVRRKKGKSIHLDGDPHKSGKVLEMQVNPLSLNIIVP